MGFFSRSAKPSDALDPVVLQMENERLRRQLAELQTSVEAERAELERLERETRDTRKVSRPHGSGHNARWREPDLLLDALRSIPSANVGCCGYFQDAIKELRPFDKMQFKLFKRPAKGVLPDGWTIPEGCLAVIGPNGKMVGQLSDKNVNRHGFVSGRKYYGYIYPPTTSMYFVYTRNDESKVVLFTGLVP